jgi:hypothetical protein
MRLPWEREEPTGFGCQNVVQTCSMTTTRQWVDKDTFKQIFRDHWETFKQHQPHYQDRHVQAVIDKMLGCGTLEAGYTTYLCPHCLEEKRVAFSCKSSFWASIMASATPFCFYTTQKHLTVERTMGLRI